MALHEPSTLGACRGRGSDQKGKTIHIYRWIGQALCPEKTKCPILKNSALHAAMEGERKKTQRGKQRIQTLFELSRQHQQRGRLKVITAAQKMIPCPQVLCEGHCN